MPKGKKDPPRASPYRKYHPGEAADGSTRLVHAGKSSFATPAYSHQADGGKASLSDSSITGAIDDKSRISALLSNNPLAQLPADRKALPLHFFYDTKSTFYRVHEDHITEMAATVEDSTKTATEPDFASSVFTPNPADPEDFGESMQNKKDFFPLVLAKFLQWMTSKTKEISQAKGILHHPVLVAHKGFAFHYPMLISEIYRYNMMEMVEGIFEKYNILFSDSILHVHEQKDETGRVVSMSRGMSLDMLYKKHFPVAMNMDINWYMKQVQNLGKPHEALERAEKLRRVYTETYLRDSISGIPRHSYRNQHQLWETSAERRKLRVTYNLKCSETKKLLIELNVSHATLMECYTMAEDSDIDRYLRHKGIVSKALRMKLVARIKEMK